MKVGTRHLFSYLCNTILLKCVWTSLQYCYLLQPGRYLQLIIWMQEVLSTYLHMHYPPTELVSLFLLCTSDTPPFNHVLSYAECKNNYKKLKFIYSEKSTKTLKYLYILWTWQITSIEIGSFCQICQSCFFIEIFRLFLSQIIF